MINTTSKAALETTIACGTTACPKKRFPGVTVIRLTSCRSMRGKPSTESHSRGASDRSLTPLPRRTSPITQSGNPSANATEIIRARRLSFLCRRLPVDRAVFASFSNSLNDALTPGGIRMVGTKFELPRTESAVAYACSSRVCNERATCPSRVRRASSRALPGPTYENVFLDLICRTNARMAWR